MICEISFMSSYEIRGKKRLEGEYVLQRAKNSALAVMCASVLVKGGTFIKDCPDISDVDNLSAILTRIGAVVRRTGDGLYVNTDGVYSSYLPEDLCEKLRASLFLAGPLVARFKAASFAYPGGCSIGARPIDIHLDGFSKLGAEVGKNEKRVNVFASSTIGAKIKLRYPSVGATLNVMCCAVTAKGETVVENAAAEPEVKDVADYLSLCGAKIKGAGTSVLIIDGVEKLHGGKSFTPVPDRIECGSVLLAVLATGGEVAVRGANPANICNLLQKLRDNACKIHINNDIICIITNGRAKGFEKVVTAPYPAFPTDLHPQLAACAATAAGRTEITETVFDSRFNYARQLKRFGADVPVNPNGVTINGTDLTGANVKAEDLRGGMALCIAAMAAEGVSTVEGVSHIARGYASFKEKFNALGASIAEIDP